MKYVYSIIAILLLSAFGSIAQDFPKVEISNGVISAGIYIPDKNAGYYRAMRFDWSGVIFKLTYREHEYFGQWFLRHDPQLHDAVLGPVEEFTEIGYDRAEPGEEFLKIGVGGLLKPKENQFRRFGLYEISDPGKWSIKTSRNKVDFMHEINDVGEYSYKYKKTITLIKDKPQLVIEHTLENTGVNKIETDVYNHNFFTIDSQPTGPDIVIRFPFEIIGKPQKSDSLAIVEGNDISYARMLNAGEHVFISNLQGYGNDVKDYDFRIENHKTRAGVRITADRPVSKMVFWASPATSCPEPYIDINIAPGERFTWKIVYDFYIF